MLLTPAELGALQTGTLVKATHRTVRALVYIVELWTDEDRVYRKSKDHLSYWDPSTREWTHPRTDMPRLAEKYVYGHSWVNGKRSAYASMFVHEKYTFERLTVAEEEEVALFALSRF